MYGNVGRGFQSGLVWAEQKAWPKILKKGKQAPHGILTDPWGACPFFYEKSCLSETLKSALLPFLTEITLGAGIVFVSQRGDCKAQAAVEPHGLFVGFGIEISKSKAFDDPGN